MSGQEPSLPPGRKRGRPVDRTLQWLRENYPLWSERTIARYKAAMDRLIALGFTQADIDRTIADAKRKRGTLRVHLLERYARAIFDQAVAS